MPNFRCNSCNALVEGMLFRCPTCGAMGKGFTEVDDTTRPDTAPLQESPPIPPQPHAPTPHTPTPDTPPAPSPPENPVPAPTSADSPPSAAAPRVDAPPVEDPPISLLPTREAGSAGEAPAAAAGPPRPRRIERMLWSFRVGQQRPASGPSRGCAAVDRQGRVFVALQDQLLCFLPDSHQPHWTYRAGTRICGSPALGPDGCVRLHSTDGRLHSVDADGKPSFPPILVSQPLGWSSPLVDTANNTWICRHDGGLAKIDASGQTTRRTFFRARHRFDCTGIVHDNVLFVGCENHYVYAIPLEGDVGRNRWAESLELGRTGGGINCPLAMTSQQEILAVSQNDMLHAFGTDGRALWQFPLEGSVLGSPVVDADDTIYVTVNRRPLDRKANAVLVAIDGRAHVLAWGLEVDSPIESTPVLGEDGMLYFGDDRGTIHAVDSRGRSVWTTEVGAPVRSAGTLIAAGRLAFTRDDGTFVVLECSSQDLNPGPWPKLLGGARQSGQTNAGGFPDSSSPL